MLFSSLKAGMNLGTVVKPASVAPPTATPQAQTTSAPAPTPLVPILLITLGALFIIGLIIHEATK